MAKSSPNASSNDDLENLCLHSLLAGQADLTPDAIAILAPDRMLWYCGVIGKYKFLLEPTGERLKGPACYVETCLLAPICQPIPPLPILNAVFL